MMTSFGNVRKSASSVLIMLVFSGCVSGQPVKNEPEMSRIDCDALADDRTREGRQRYSQCLSNVLKSCEAIAGKAKFEDKLIAKYRRGNAMVEVRQLCFTGGQIKHCVKTTCPRHSPDFIAGIKENALLLGIGVVIGFAAGASPAVWMFL